MSNADYVVVGAGSAGCVVAARLAEVPDARVVVLEAGGADSLEAIHQPPMFPCPDAIRIAVAYGDWLLMYGAPTRWVSKNRCRQ